MDHAETYDTVARFVEAATVRDADVVRLGDGTRERLRALGLVPSDGFAAVRTVGTTSDPDAFFALVEAFFPGRDRDAACVKIAAAGREEWPRQPYWGVGDLFMRFLADDPHRLVRLAFASRRSFPEWFDGASLLADIARDDPDGAVRYAAALSLRRFGE